MGRPGIRWLWAPHAPKTRVERFVQIEVRDGVTAEFGRRARFRMSRRAANSADGRRDNPCYKGRADSSGTE